MYQFRYIITNKNNVMFIFTTYTQISFLYVQFNIEYICTKNVYTKWGYKDHYSDNSITPHG